MLGGTNKSFGRRFHVQNIRFHTKTYNFIDDFMGGGGTNKTFQIKYHILYTVYSI